MYVIINLIISPQASAIPIIFCLQGLLDEGSTIKAYLAAVSACQVGLKDMSVGQQHPLVSFYGVSSHLVPSWDLS